MTAVLFDFSDPKSVALWNPINDGVMGGSSRSQLRHDTTGHAVFSGEVSFANNGGFASVRCQPSDLGRNGVTAYLLSVRGDGKRYKLNLRTDNSFDGVNYQVQFDPPAGLWTTCRLPSADFLPSWRGRPGTGYAAARHRPRAADWPDDRRPAGRSVYIGRAIDCHRDQLIVTDDVLSGSMLPTLATFRLPSCSQSLSPSSSWPSPWPPSI